jgi:hypothetical protein
LTEQPDPTGRWPIDTTELQAAYQAVLDLAARPGGDSGEVPADEEGAWAPADVLAHLIANDRLMIRAVRSVLDGAVEPYDNADAISLAELRALTDDLGGPAGLAAALEASSQELLALAGRLDEAQAATPLPVRIVDNGEVFLDRPIPVASLLATQARAHLPMHRRQLGERLDQP